MGIVAAMILAAAVPVRAIETVILIDRELSRQSIQLIALADGRIRYFGPDRDFLSMPIEQAVRLDLTDAPIVSDAAGESAQSTPKVLRLIDGQTLPGKFLGVTESGNIQWETSSLGTFETPMDRVAFVDVTTPSDSRNDSAVPKEDTLHLLNGDTLTGFIESVRPDSLKLTRAGGTIELPWASIIALRLANPVNVSRGVWMKLHDSTRVLIDTPVIRSGRVSGIVLGVKIDLPIEAVASLEFALQHRLISLADLPRKVTSGGVVFGVNIEPEFAADQARLHAPLILTFEIPRNARRFAADASIDPVDLPLADMILTFADPAGELFTTRLHDAHPDARVNIPIRDRTLTLTLDPGEQGPIRDRLQLKNAAVLVELK